MDYKSVAEARDMPGLRLALSKGGPGPWGEAAKGIFHVKSIAFTPVAQIIGEENAELRAWTGLRNAPIAVLDDQQPLDRWLDILMLAERLAPEPRLLPRDSHERALVIGIGNELCGAWGLGCCRRASFIGALDPDKPKPQSASYYPVSAEEADAAPGRMADILRMLSNRLKAQHEVGSSYLVGRVLTAADIYSAAFLNMFQPMPPERCPLPDFLRQIYSLSDPVLDAAKDPILFEHRDMIYTRHLKLPMDF